MKKQFAIGTILLASGVGAADICYAPDVASGLKTCSICPEGQLQGASCTRDGRWMPCYDNVDSCCYNGELANHASHDECLAVSSSSDGSNGGDSGSPTPPPVSADYCQKVVSKSYLNTNQECMFLCDNLVTNGIARPENDQDFSTKCEYAHWHQENGRTVIDGDCFEKWVYGYSEPADLASYIGGLMTETPAQCQLLCQQDNECVNWLWMAPLSSTGARSCFLKNEVLVSVPLNMVSQQSTDTKYCNYNTPQLCATGFYNCLTCDNLKRCVWQSDMHVSGWKYCGVTEQCSLPPLPTKLPTLSTATMDDKSGTDNSEGRQTTAAAISGTPTLGDESGTDNGGSETTTVMILDTLTQEDGDNTDSDTGRKTTAAAISDAPTLNNDSDTDNGEGRQTTVAVVSGAPTLSNDSDTDNGEGRQTTAAVISVSATLNNDSDTDNGEGRQTTAAAILGTPTLGDESGTDNGGSETTTVMILDTLTQVDGDNTDSDTGRKTTAAVNSVTPTLNNDSDADNNGGRKTTNAAVSVTTTRDGTTTSDSSNDKRTTPAFINATASWTATTAIIMEDEWQQPRFYESRN